MNEFEKKNIISLVSLVISFTLIFIFTFYFDLTIQLFELRQYFHFFVFNFNSFRLTRYYIIIIQKSLDYTDLESLCRESYSNYNNKIL